MNNDQVIRLLIDYKSYKYALKNVGSMDTGLPLISATRLNGDLWDATRYARIVGMIEGAVNELLTDDQRMVIMRKYLDRDSDSVTLKDLADLKHRDRGTIARWHKEALRRLTVALAPLGLDEAEITNVDHMFDPSWRYKESA